MAVNPSSANVAGIGPLQNIGFQFVDVGALGPNGETVAKALLVAGTVTATVDETSLATSANQVIAINGATNTNRILSAAATTNATSAKASAGTVRQVSGFNAAATARFLKFYDKASAPTVGTDTPRKTIYLPAGVAFVFDCIDHYTVGIAYAMTTAAADNDTGALTAGDVLCLNVDYL